MKKNALMAGGFLLSAIIWVLSLVQDNVSKKETEIELREMVKEEVERQTKSPEGE